MIIREGTPLRALLQSFIIALFSETVHSAYSWYRNFLGKSFQHTQF